MKKAILFTLAAILLIPSIALGQQYTKGNIGLADTVEMPGLATMVTGGNKIEYTLSMQNTGQTAYIAKAELMLSGRTSTCTGVAADKPVIPGLADWQIDVADSSGTPVWDAPYIAEGGTLGDTSLPDVVLEAGQTVTYTVIVITPAQGLSGGEELTLTSVMWDMGSNSMISVDCEDITVTTPGGLITLEFIQVLLVGGGSALAILGTFGFFV